MAAELAATGKAETSMFHTLFAGKSGQLGAPGSGVLALPWGRFRA